MGGAFLPSDGANDRFVSTFRQTLAEDAVGPLSSNLDTPGASPYDAGVIPRARNPVPRTFLLILIVGSLWWLGWAARVGPGWGIIMVAAWLVAIGIGAWFVGYDSREKGDWPDR